jgi:hypothetical protein
MEGLSRGYYHGKSLEIAAPPPMRRLPTVSTMPSIASILQLV